MLRTCFKNSNTPISKAISIDFYLLLKCSLSLLLLFTFNTPSLAKVSSPTNSTTTSPTITTILDQQRVLYKQALESHKKKQYRKFNQIKNQLTHYPLYPYLQFKYLNRNLNQSHYIQISEFLDRYADSPVSTQLRARLLHKLAAKKQWKGFLQFYQPQSSASLECTYLKALHKEGFELPAFQQAPRLWLVGKSQHKHCDYIFKKFEQAELLTDDLIWQRIELAMKNNHPALAKFLAKKLNPTDARWVKLWVRTHYKPQRLYKAALLNTKHIKRANIVTHGIKRLARRNPEAAIELMSFIKNKTGLHYHHEVELYKKIGLSMARRHHPDAELWLNKIPDPFITRYVRQWKIQGGIRNADWHKVIRQVESLPVVERQKIRWQFWWAYAHKQLDHKIDAEETLKRLATKRDYYGFLAADLLNLPYQFENSPITVNANQVAEISALKPVQRSRELHFMNQLVQARREWNIAIRGFNDEQLLTAAKIVHHWGWHDRAIAAIGMTKNLNDIEVRFPLVYKDIIDDYSNRSDIDSSLTYAIIRRESIFIADAKSSKGALGLMQLLPGTARYTARTIKTRYQGKRQLIKTRPNILLGTQYLKLLLGKHQQQTVLATAAYNAGPRNVKKWLPDDEPMDAIRWIESIPFKETREYVTNVLAYKIIYQHRMGYENKTLITQLMPPVPARI